jgi:hypothetical protein
MLFKQHTGHCAPPPPPAGGDARADGARAGLVQWVRRQRHLHRRGQLRAERRERLAALDFAFAPSAALWEHRLGELAAFHRQHGHASVPEHHPPNPPLGALPAPRLPASHRAGPPLIRTDRRPCHTPAAAGRHLACEPARASPPRRAPARARSAPPRRRLRTCPPTPAPAPRAAPSPEVPVTHAPGRQRLAAPRAPSQRGARERGEGAWSSESESPRGSAAPSPLRARLRSAGRLAPGGAGGGAGAEAEAGRSSSAAAVSSSAPPPFLPY